MVHSFEIQYSLSRAAIIYCMSRLGIQIDDSLYTDESQDCATVSKKYQASFFFQRPRDKDYRVFIINEISSINSGFTTIMFIHRFIDKNSDKFYIRFKINPAILLSQKFSLDSFYCTPTNVDALQEAYAKRIMELFPLTFTNPSPLNYNDFIYDFEPEQNKLTDYNVKMIWMLSALPYLGLGSVKKVDYAINLKSPKHSLYFLSLAKRSIIDKRKKHSATFKGVEYGNKSMILGVYNRIEKDEMSESNLTFRAIIRNPSNEWKHLHLKMHTTQDDIKLYGKARGGLLPFLNEDVSEKILKEEYNKLVGPGDFYSTYKAWKIIDESNYKSDKKRNLKELMQLVSQCWSLQRAEQQYIVGTPLRKNRKIVKGTQQTFRKSIRQLRELGVQPLRIPDSWHLSHLHNPINDDVSRKILFRPEPLNQLLSKETLKKYEDTKAEIKRMLEARRIK